VPDAALNAIAEGKLNAGGALHLAETAAESTTAELQLELDAVTGDVLATGRERELELLASLETQVAAESAVGLTESDIGEGELARRRALFRDTDRLHAQYTKWFPQPIGGHAVTAANCELAAEADPKDVERVVALLDSVVEVVEITRGTEPARKADAIDLLERLLPDIGLTPARYWTITGSAHPAVRSAIDRVHGVVLAR
jgi:hypothetical protein